MELLGDSSEGSNKTGYDVTKLGNSRKLLTRRATGETIELIYKDRKRVPCADEGQSGATKKNIFSTLSAVLSL